MANGNKNLQMRSYKGLLLLGSSSAIQGVANLLFLAVLARYIKPLEYGIASAAILIVLLADSLTRLGLGAALVQRAQISDLHIRVAFTANVFISALLTIAVYALAPYMEVWFRITGLAPVLRALSICFFVRGLSVVSESLAQRDMRFRVISLAQAVSYFSGFGIIGIVLAVNGFGLWSLVWAQIAQACIRTLMIVKKIGHPKRPLFNWPILRELLPFGLDVTLVELLSYIANQGDKFIVGRALGAQALGSYGRAYQLMAAPAVAFALIADRVLFPAMAQVQTDLPRLRRGFLSAISAVSILTLPVSVLVVVLAPEIIRVWLGPGWEDAVAPLRWLAIGTFFRVGYKISGTVARAQGATRRLVVYQAIFSVAVVVLSLALSRFGTSGVAAGVSAALALEYAMLINLGLSLTKINVADYLAANRAGAVTACTVGAASAISTSVTGAASLSALGTLSVGVASGILAGALTLALTWKHLSIPESYEAANNVLKRFSRN